MIHFIAVLTLDKIKMGKRMVIYQKNIQNITMGQASHWSTIATSCSSSGCHLMMTATMTKTPKVKLLLVHHMCIGKSLMHAVLDPFYVTMDHDVLPHWKKLPCTPEHALSMSSSFVSSNAYNNDRIHQACQIDHLPPTPMLPWHLHAQFSQTLGWCIWSNGWLHLWLVSTNVWHILCLSPFYNTWSNHITTK